MQKTAIGSGYSLSEHSAALYFNRLQVFRPGFSRSIIQTLLVMKLTILLLTVSIFTAQAEGIGQRISISGKNLTLDQVFKAIESQTGYVVFSFKEVLPDKRTVSLSVNDMPLRDVLDIIMKGEPLQYVIRDKTIFISSVASEKESAETIMTAPLITVKGRVSNEKGEALAGVTLTVKGSALSTKTDEQGRFTLSNLPKGAIVVFTYVGYSSFDYKVADSDSDISITLSQQASVLNEVVMIGYGSARRRDLTGAVSSVNVKEISNTPLVTIDQALAGKAPGVQVTQSDGSPGGVARIRIRGGTSLLGGNDPLYIIDGVQVQIANQYIGAGAEITNPIETIGGSSRDVSRGQTVGSSFGRGLNTLAGLNINDIESIDILKDASATAIYGSRAANGVVIINTKKGKKNEKPLLEGNYYYGVSSAITEKVLNADQYRDIFLKGSRNLNSRLAEKSLPADPAATAYLANPALLGTANVDWLDLVTRTGQTQNADVSIRGGGSGSSYYMSLGYNNNKGTLLGTDFSRIAGKINLTNELSSKIRLIANIDLGFTTNNITNGLYGTAVLAPPTFEPFNPDGTLSEFPQAVFPGSAPGATSGIRNPMILLRSTNLAENNLILGSLALEYDILKTLKFRSSVSVNYSGSHQVTYEPSSTAVINSNLGAVPGNTGVGSQSQSQNKDLFFENTLTWDKEFNQNHRLTLLGGTSWQKTTAKQFSANGQTYPDDVYLNGLSSAAVYLRPTASEAYASLLSFYMRANYAFKERYLLTLTGRSDASSKFPQSNRVGYFPSFGVAWRMKEEAFLKNVSWLTELKIRASAGYTGTQNIGNNMFYTLYTPAVYAGSNALTPSQLGNDAIKWENTLQKDLGLDISLFNGRLSAAIGYYEKFTEGLLMASAVPESSGFSSAIVNKADIRNRGLEIELRGDVVRSRDFSWNIGMNVSGNRSKLTKLNRLLPTATTLGSDDPVITGESIGNNALIPGEPLGNFYGAIYRGILTTQKDVTDYIYNPATSPNGSIWVTFAPTSNTIGIGSPRYQTYGDAYGNKALATFFYNRTKIGSAQADFFGGMTHTFSYKQFSLIANLTYSYGGDILYLYENNSLGLGSVTNKSARILLPTYQDDPNSDRPTLYLKENNVATGAGASTQNVFDASYIKMKSINISYGLPASLVSKIGLKSGMIYIAGSNLFAITSYPGPDPEVSNDPYSIIGGNTDDASYPQVRQYTFGARFTF